MPLSVSSIYVDRNSAPLLMIYLYTHLHTISNPVIRAIERDSTKLEALKRVTKKGGERRNKQRKLLTYPLDHAIFTFFLILLLL